MKKKALTVLGILSLLLILLFATPYMLRSWASFFIVSTDDFGNFDALVVPSGESSYRALFAIKRFKKGGISHLVLCSLQRPPIGSRKPDAFYEKEEALKNGIPENKIIILSPRYSTADEARLFKKLCLKKGWKRVLIATDPFHTRRALLAYRRELSPYGVDVKIAHPSLKEEGLSLKKWWTRERELIWVFNETAKYILYLVYPGRTEQ